MNGKFTGRINRRNAIKDELQAFAERVRDIEAATVTLSREPTQSIWALIRWCHVHRAVGGSLGSELAVGVTARHALMRSFLKRYIGALATPATGHPQLPRLGNARPL